MFCTKCGEEINDEAVICVHCGCAVPGKNISAKKDGKSRVIAGCLGLFFGVLGVHNFYLGKYIKGIAQLFIFIGFWIILVVGEYIAYTFGFYYFAAFLPFMFPVLLIGLYIWVLVDSIRCFTGSYKDANGRDLV